MNGNFPLAKVSSVENIMAVYIFDYLRRNPGFNKLVADGKLNVEGTNVNIKFFLGGVYKFIQMMLGLKGAISNYPCAW